MIDIPYYDNSHNRLTAEGVVQSADLGSETVYACLMSDNTSPTYNITEEMLGKKIVFVGYDNSERISMTFKNTTGYNLVLWRLQYFSDSIECNVADIAPNSTYGISSGTHIGVSNYLNGIIVFSRYTSVPEV